MKRKKQEKQSALTFPDQPLKKTHAHIKQMWTEVVVHLALCAAVKCFLGVCRQTRPGSLKRDVSGLNNLLCVQTRQTSRQQKSSHAGVCSRQKDGQPSIVPCAPTPLCCRLCLSESHLTQPNGSPQPTLARARYSNTALPDWEKVIVNSVARGKAEATSGDGDAALQKVEVCLVVGGV